MILCCTKYKIGTIECETLENGVAPNIKCLKTNDNAARLYYCTDENSKEMLKPCHRCYIWIEYFERMKDDISMFLGSGFCQIVKIYFSFDNFERKDV